MVAFARAPYEAARRLTAPTRANRVEDPAVRGAQLARTIVGTAATVWLYLSYPVVDEDNGLVENKFADAIASALGMSALAPLGIGLFLLAARPGSRAALKPRLRGPAAALGCVLGLILLLLTLPLVERLGSGSGAMAATLVLGPVTLFAAVTLFCAVVLCVHHAFRAGDVHEVLPPLILPVLSWATSLFQLFQDAPVAAPGAVRAAYLLGPPLTVTALSWWELRRLRLRHRLTVRSALGRAPAPAGSAGSTGPAPGARPRVPGQ
ncbi:hypothetical protein ACN20G_30450 (plasmid) [Streptomyces sp. BI20]|uniref:hypothetical protein n=1 Tax=Streptomyces sp. BI20 TaxID=3403460 RepID=UPI003C78281D